VFEALAGWPVDRACAAAIMPDGSVHLHGDGAHEYRLASVSKLMTAWAALVAVEDGSLDLDAPLDDGGSLRHLLAHAGGYGFDSPGPIGSPGRRRVYSNTGYDRVAVLVESATGIAFADYLAESVFQPLGRAGASLRGSAARDVHATLDDVVRFSAELRSPRLLARSTVADAISPQFGDLDGTVPGIGPFSPCPWGLGPELHGDKYPHWMPERASRSTFGHFGGSGTFVWVDPVANVACLALTDREFGPWALEAWPAFGAAVLAAARP
jgi:CubicO group peptidase (beta-lactamase class C family)